MRLAWSASSIASEYASSPVAQPATQARTSSVGLRSRKMAGRMSRSSVSNASRSRKKFVTPIRRSFSSSLCSPTSASSRRRYSGSECTARTCMRRSIRRSTVARLYWRKSWPVCARSRPRTRCRACSASALSSSSVTADAGKSAGPAGGSSIALAFFHKSTSFCGISTTGSTKSTSPVPMAASGMPSCSASPGCWTMITPPVSLTRPMPTAPSPPVPDNTMASARSRWASASVRKNASMAMCWPRGRCISATVRLPSIIVSCLLGAIT